MDNLPELILPSSREVFQLPRSLERLFRGRGDRNVAKPPCPRLTVCAHMPIPGCLEHPEAAKIVALIEMFDRLQEASRPGFFVCANLVSERPDFDRIGPGGHGQVKRLDLADGKRMLNEAVRRTEICQAVSRVAQQDDASSPSTEWTGSSSTQRADDGWSGASKLPPQAHSHISARWMCLFKSSNPSGDGTRVLQSIPKPVCIATKVA